MKYAEFDCSRLPFVYVRINKLTPTVQQYADEFLKPQSDLLDRYENMVCILDSRNVTLLSSEHRIVVGNWVKAHSEDLKKKVRVVILVCCSFWTEMMVKGVLLIVKSPVPFHLCADVEAAHTLLLEKYQIFLPGKIVDDND